jgi:probable rRNA maturation factor
MPAFVRWEGAGRCAVSVATVRRRADAMLRALRLSQAELSVLLCEDERMRELNRAYRARDRPTDVLAFAMGEGQVLASPVSVLGDVVISVPTAVDQAAAHARAPLHEVTLLLAHGLLQHRARKLSVGHVKLKHNMAWWERHVIKVGNIPGTYNMPARVGVVFHRFNYLCNLVDTTSIISWPRPPLVAVNMAQFSVFISPFVPDAYSVLFQIIYIGFSLEEP